MTKLWLSFALTCTLALAPAQESRKVEAYPWDLYPPLEDVPCPSHFERLDTPKDLAFGTFKLATSLPAIVDGDTIRVEELKESLRFLGLDAEETFKDPAKKRLATVNWPEYLKTETAAFAPDRPPKYGSFMGEAAKDAMRRLLDGVTLVRLEWDDPERKVDNFGRHLVFVYFQKQNGPWVNLNVEIVRQGLSPYFIKYGRARRLNDRFEAAEQEARAHERGIWATPGRYPHYPDYAVRLVWWRERADALAAAEALARTRGDVFILGRDSDWERLRAMAGKKAIVVGTANPPIKRSSVTLLPFGHKRNKDFLVVGSEAEIASLDPKKEDGNLLFVSGIVELYKGEPQFRAQTVSWSRTPPPVTESRPASR
jgi:endonuclease YncB( thermonuclease family)